ncbi:MAG TPA: amidohydrolase [Jatrophihabitantaceae bacterium]
MTPAADLAVLGSGVWIGDGTRTDALAVRDGRIVAHGTDDVRDLVGPRTRVLDRPGALVVPGFQDCHVHAPPAGRERLTIDLHDLPGRQAYLDTIAAYAAAKPDVGWLTGGGWAFEHFPGAVPRREDLDAITGPRPAFIFNRDVHGAWVNTAALERAGIDATTPDPSDGRYERDEDGTPSGMLHEGAAYSFRTRWVPEPTRAEWEQAILVAQQHLYTLGITGWQDAWVTPETFAGYVSLASSGRLTAHVVGALWWDRHRGLDQIPEFRAQREQGVGTFRPTTVKIMVDGIIENQTASLLEPYCAGCGAGESRGLDYVDRDLLIAAVTELDALGFQVHMHAIGDRAIRNALDAVEAARTSNGPSDNRHHIAHLQVVQPSDLRRFAELDVVANCQTYWAQSEPQMDELTIPFIGRDRGELQYPFEDLRRAGAHLAMGSDWAVTTADPLQQMEVAVRRIDPENRDNAPFLPDQRLSLDAALSAFTAGSAFTNHDADAGTLTVGSRADLAVVDQDLFEMDGLCSDARVVCTVSSGGVVHVDDALN